MARSILAILCIVSMIPAVCLGKTANVIEEVRVNGQIIEEGGIVYILPGEILEVIVKTDEEGYEIIPYYYEEDFQVMEESPSGGKSYRIVLKAVGDWWNSEISFEAAKGGKSEDFYLDVETVDMEDPYLELEITEPEEQGEFAEGDTIYFSLESGLWEEEEEALGISYEIIITKDGDSDFRETARKKEWSTRRLNDGLYYVEATATDRFGRTSSAYCSFIVWNTKDGNNVYINHQNTPPTVMLGEPVDIDISGSGADMNLSFFVYISGEEPRQLPYKKGIRNKLYFEHTFYSAGEQTIRVAARKFGETKNITEKKFTINVVDPEQYSYDQGGEVCRSCGNGDSYCQGYGESGVYEESLFSEASREIAKNGKVESPVPCETPGFSLLTAVGMCLFMSWRQGT